MTSLFNLKTSQHQDLEGRSTFTRVEVVNCLEGILNIVYPGNLRKVFHSESEFEKYQQETILNLTNILHNSAIEADEVQIILNAFTNSLLEIARMVHSDAIALYSGDPSATCLSEVILTYPGLEAIATHRIAHFFYQSNVPILPRAFSEIAHGKTGIDIHPGAQIGESFFIDHGTGVVIGETAVIGVNVKIYQGVTLGALSVDKSLAQKKRHPSIEDNVVIYSHATILGGETVIGNGCVIGGNVWVTKSIPPRSVVYHKSEVRLNSLGDNDEKEITYEI